MYSVQNFIKINSSLLTFFYKMISKETLDKKLNQPVLKNQKLWVIYSLREKISYFRNPHRLIFSLLG